jgi:LCP family protein required for cell wall assembly
MGIDESGEIDGEGTGQVDFLMILSFNSNTKEYTMIPINRDSMVEVNEVDMLGNVRTVYKQIALSHSVVGSEGLTNEEKCNNTVNAVSRILHGMKFDGYMSMTMDAVDILVDRFGGVDVYLEDDYTSVDPRLTSNTTVTMDGALAMKFVRMRGGLEDSSNIARMKRQETFLKAFFKKMGEAQSGDDELLETYSEIEKYVYNSSGVDGYEEILWKLKHYEEGESLTLRGEAIVGRGGYMEFYVDDSHVQEVIADVFYKKATE